MRVLWLVLLAAAALGAGLTWNSRAREWARRRAWQRKVGWREAQAQRATGDRAFDDRAPERRGVARAQPPVCLLDEEECPGRQCSERTCSGASVPAGAGGRCRCRPGLARDPRTGNCLGPGRACPDASRTARPSVVPSAPSPRGPPVRLPEDRPDTFAPVQPRPRPPTFPTTNFNGASRGFGLDPDPGRACDEGQRSLKKGGQTILYRLYKELDKDHMLTRFISEVSTAIQGSLYNFEGPIGRLAGSENDVLVPCPELRPLYRLYRPWLLGANHFYTTKPDHRSKAQDLLKEFYFDQGVSGYCTLPAACGASLPLYRFYDEKNIDHFYTTKESDLQLLNRGGQQWVSEGVECYLWPL